MVIKYVWRNFEIIIYATLLVKKIHFSSSSMALFSIGFSQLRFKTLTLALYCSLPHLHCLHEHQVHHRQLAIFFLWARKKEIKKWRLLPLLPAFILSSTPKISVIPAKQVYFINSFQSTVSLQSINSLAILLTGSKGQLISKYLFGVFNFFQKTNVNTSYSSKNEFIRSFFGRIHGFTIFFRN